MYVCMYVCRNAIIVKIFPVGVALLAWGSGDRVACKKVAVIIGSYVHSNTEVMVARRGGNISGRFIDSDSATGNQ